MYKERRSFDERCTESRKILQKYKDRIPIICERHAKRSDTLPEVDKHKYLVPRDLTVGQFCYVLRKRMKLTADQAVFVFTEGGSLPPAGHPLQCIYESHHDLDGFLYLRYAGESTFGADDPDASRRVRKASLPSLSATHSLPPHTCPAASSPPSASHS